LTRDNEVIVSNLYRVKNSGSIGQLQRMQYGDKKNKFQN